MVRTARGIFCGWALRWAEKSARKGKFASEVEFPPLAKKKIFGNCSSGKGYLCHPLTYPPLPHSSYAKKRTMYPKICFCLVPNLVSAIKHWKVLFFSPYSIRLRSKISVEKKVPNSLPSHILETFKKPKIASACLHFPLIFAAQSVDERSGGHNEANLKGNILLSF